MLLLIKLNISISILFLLFFMLAMTRAKRLYKIYNPEHKKRR